MSIDYFGESEKHKPKEVKLLLVGEAPPPSGTRYFYLPMQMNPNRDIRGYMNLPATIFNHHFQTIPSSEEEYKLLLNRLKEEGIFLMDLFDKPIRVRERHQINPDSLEQIIRAIPRFRWKMRNRDIYVSDKNIIFLDPSHGYEKEVAKEFPTSKIIRWVDYRMSKD